MAITSHFYNELMKKYIVMFGNLFNDMKITRHDNSGAQKQKIIVPIAYAPRQKWLTQIKQNGGKDQKSSITLPRMSFEIANISYDPERKLAKHKSTVSATGSADTVRVMYAPTPYNIDFTLSIATKYEEDGFKIIEQILPYFQPNLTSTVDIIPGVEKIDIPIILNGFSMEDNYEGDYEERRMIVWTLTFTMKTLMFGPVRDQKVIKYIDVRLFDSFTANTSDSANGHVSQIITRPGLTSSGQPTTDPTNSVPYTQIKKGDKWGVITEVKT